LKAKFSDQRNEPDIGDGAAPHVIPKALDERQHL
jgi:hypothetical protein